MAKRTVEFKTPVGTWKRQTNRDYQFLILCQSPREEKTRASHERTMTTYRSNRDYYDKGAKGERHMYPKETAEGCAAERDKLDKWIEQGEETLRLNLERHAKDNAAGVYFLVGYSTKMELAVKEASRSTQFNTGVKIFNLSGAQVWPK